MAAIRIGLLSDTHVPDRAPGLHPQVWSALEGVDLILHAGDISSPFVLAELGRIAPAVAVRGNNLGDWTRFQPPLPRRRVVRVEGWRLGMHHGMDSLPQRVVDFFIGNFGGKAACARYIIRRLRRQFAPGEVDAVLYGHAHWPLIRPVDGVLYLNPGQCFGDEDSSLMLLDLAPGQLQVRLVTLGIERKLQGFAPREIVWTRPV